MDQTVFSLCLTCDFVLINVNVSTSNQQLQAQIDTLQSQIQTSAITVEVYNQEATLLKNVTYLPSEAGMSLFDLLGLLEEEQKLTSQRASSGWISAVEGIEGIGQDNLYWVIFSPTNVACAGYSDPGYTFGDVCQVGSKDIIIGFHDTFVFRLLAWSSGS